MQFDYIPVSQLSKSFNLLSYHMWVIDIWTEIEDLHCCFFLNEFVKDKENWSKTTLAQFLFLLYEFHTYLEVEVFTEWVEQIILTVNITHHVVIH